MKSRNSTALGRQRGRDLCESFYSISFCCIGESAWFNLYVYDVLVGCSEMKQNNLTKMRDKLARQQQER